VSRSGTQTIVRIVTQLSIMKPNVAPTALNTGSFTHAPCGPTRGSLANNRPAARRAGSGRRQAVESVAGRPHLARMLTHDSSPDMPNTLVPIDPLGAGDDFVATFQIEDTSVRGRIARLGDGVLDPILKRHAYPRWAAYLLGEAVTLAVLVSASLKFDGKVMVQAQGEGPVSLMVAEARLAICA
jgi:hypothetical protein